MSRFWSHPLKTLVKNVWSQETGEEMVDIAGGIFHFEELTHREKTIRENYMKKNPNIIR